MAKKKTNWKKKMWEQFSRLVRLEESDSNGYCKCVTCGKVDHWKKFQAGHFIDSRNNSLLDNRELVHAQCLHCNVFLHGNKVKYTLYMLSLGYSPEQISEFENLKFATCKVSQPEWKEKHDIYKEKADALEKKKSYALDLWDTNKKTTL